MNKLYQQLNPQSQNSIPQLLNNPKFKQVVELVKNSKLPPKELFYKLAKEKGVDPETILKQLR